MILLKSINASVENIRLYNRNIAKIKKIKRSTLLRELGLKKKDLEIGNYYKVIEDKKEREGVFSKIYGTTEQTPLTKKLTEEILIKEGNYNVKQPTLINASSLPYKYKILKNNLTLQEDIYLKKGIVVTPFIHSLQEIFALTPYKREIIPVYLIKDKGLVHLTPIKSLIDSFAQLFFKNINIKGSEYIMDIEQLKALIILLSKKIDNEKELLALNKKLSEDLSLLSFEDVFSLIKEQKTQVIPEEVKKEEVIEEKIEEEEDLDFF